MIPNDYSRSNLIRSDCYDPVATAVA
jgi:hypothetical protein